MEIKVLSGAKKRKEVDSGEFSIVLSMESFVILELSLLVHCLGNILQL